MEKIIPLEENSIYQIYIESQEIRTYVIPIYQRNYAWEEDEIASLIKDVYDSFHKNRNTLYYIGTLVSYKRGDSDYEVIDGQQRLTTIYIILKVLGIKHIKNRLTFSARKVSASTIDRLDNYPDLGIDVDNGIRNGYKYAEKAIHSIIDQAEIKTFEQYLLHNVHIIHYRVPKDVDLNHYFEVMNSRGEQLEKHEIVKSILGQHLKDKTELATFCHVWEVCSEMNIYIQQAFPSSDIFGYNLNKFKISKFEEIPQQDESDKKDTIMNLLQGSLVKMDDDRTIEQNDKFQPIIDFPNFLLIVLKLTQMASKNFNYVNFILDDKELLNEFDKTLKSIDRKAEFVKKFTFNLLKAKFLLDNYIVHHALSNRELLGDNPWKLQYYYLETKKKKYPKNFSGIQDIQKGLVQLLSMFEVSFTPKQRKNYLFYCLMFLFENMDTTDKDYLSFLQHLADKYFFNVYLNAKCLNDSNQPGPNAFDNALLLNGKLQIDGIVNDGIDYKQQFEKIYKQGKSDIPLFVFNYTDYKLWAKYAETLRGSKIRKGSNERNNFFAKLGCSDFDLEPFKNFYFSRTRKSLEHYYPTAKAVKDDIASEYNLGISQINCFGNFAMIGSDANSSGSNWDPKTKLDHYIDGKSDPISVSSLKFRIMMQMCQDNQIAILNGNLVRMKGMEWNHEDIQYHQNKMLEIILSDR